MSCNYLAILSIFMLICLSVNGFKLQSKLQVLKNQGNRLYAIDKNAIQVLEEMKGKYERLVNVDSPEATTECETLKDTVEKYKSYLEVKKLMGKLRLIRLNEASEQRKEKQLKNFIDLLKGRLELEERLKEKLGLSHNKNVTLPTELNELNSIDAKIHSLEEKLQKSEIILPKGKRTLDDRFAS